MTLALSIVECLAFGLYSAIFLWCGVRNAMRPNTVAIARLMKAGPVLGLSMGTGIFALIAVVWLSHGRFALTDHPRWAQLTFAALFALWVSNLVFEIWTLDPIRKASAGADDCSGAIARTRRHLLVHCGLIVGLWMPWLTTFR